MSAARANTSPLSGRRRNIEKRARAYLAKMPPAISGQGGHDATFRVALALVQGYSLPPDRALAILIEDYNPRCEPPWSLGELRHKVDDAANKAKVPPGYVLDKDRDWTAAVHHLQLRPLPTGVADDSDLGTAHYFRQLHGRDVRHVHGFGWLVWDGKAWRHDKSGALVSRKLHQTVRTLAVSAGKRLVAAAQAERESEQTTETAHELKAARYLLKWVKVAQNERRIAAALGVARTLDGITADHSAFDQRHDRLTVSNGTIDLRTGKLLQHQREDYITKALDIAYDPVAKAPMWERVLDRALDGNDELISFFQRAAGYSITGSTTEQVFFLCYGTGANGKSTVLEAIKRVMGGHAATTATDTVMHARQRGADNDLARLRGVRIVSAVESGAARRLDEERIKRLTGGDTITARFLYQDYFEFRPQFKLWLACNNRPEIAGTDVAIWRRVRLIPFVVTIPEGERDGQLPEKLQREAAGILAWLVAGAVAWYRDGLRTPAAVTDAMAGYRIEQDVIARFVADCCVVGEHVACPSGHLYRAYLDWGKLNGEGTITARAFGARLTTAGYQRGRNRSLGRHYVGIGLKPREGRDA